MSRSDAVPTMIIPAGTEIQIDIHGQLSVRTPGNLVIQNSGHYGEIESVGGSIRIEAGAEVEAVSVRCAETCYVQGSLTSWRVRAKSIHLEEKAQARVVLQETEGLEIGRNAQMVGNFGSEKELFLLFSRFAQQLRSLPFYFDRGSEGAGSSAGTPPPAPAGAALEGAGAGRPGDGNDEGRSASQAEGDASPAASLPNRLLAEGEELPDALFFALVLLEREARNDVYGSTSKRVMEELVQLLRDRDLETTRYTHRTLFERVIEPQEDLRRAQELVSEYFATHPEPDRSDS